MKKIAIAMLCAGVIVLGGALPVRGQGGETRQAKIIQLDFDPRDFTVGLGTTVTWTNTDSRPHTVTDRAGTFDTGPVTPGQTGKVTFSTPGRYAYFCRINPGRMNGTIEVRPGAEPSKTARVQAIDEARQAPQTPFRFDPAELTVEAGTAIVFGNVGGKPHTLTADDGEAFDTGVVAPGPEGGKFAGSNATFVVTEPGTFPFHCEVHPAAMKGVLTVTGEAVASAPGAASAAPREATVEMRDFEFQNSEVAVAPRGSVTWRNVGAVQHSAQFDDVELDTGILQPGNEGSLTAPDDPGNYSYFCAVHPQRMRGVLVVLGQNVADPTEVALAKAPEAAGSGGPPGGIPALALATGVAGAFLGGMGVASFMRRRPPEAAIPAEAGGPETRAGPTALR